MSGHAGQVKTNSRMPAPAERLVSRELEGALRGAVADRVGETRFGLWFGDGVRMGLAGDGGSVEVQVPNAYFRDRIRSCFAASLADAVREVLGRPLPVSYSVQDEAQPVTDAEVVPEKEAPAGGGGGRRPAVTVPIPGAPSSSPSSSPRPPASPDRGIADRRELFGESAKAPAPAPGAGRVTRRLDDFVVGPTTQLAFAAAREMIQSGGRTFNPLVIHGGVGLGKTHLLEAIAVGLRGAHPGLNVLHVSAETFTNGFLEAMRTSSLSTFRNRYRNAAALIIDDVHFLAAKRATQDEFLFTFNALIERGAAIILSSDQHPRKIAKLTDELATRFLGGMVVKLDAPDVETRKAILRSKIRSRNAIVPPGVVDYIAENVKTSVRELEGALHCVLAQAALMGKSVTMTAARAALRETIRNTNQAVALRDVENAVRAYFHLDADGLKSESRVRTLAYPRMLAMYLARKHAGLSYSEIGRYFGGRNHSTVMSAEKKVIGWLKAETTNPLLPGFDNVVDILADLEATLGA